ncbi:MAG: hypothetical protein RIT45_617 [Pseudomonadota bacterium]
MALPEHRRVVGLDHAAGGEFGLAGRVAEDEDAAVVGDLAAAGRAAADRRTRHAGIADGLGRGRVDTAELRLTTVAHTRRPVVARRGVEPCAEPSLGAGLVRPAIDHEQVRLEGGAAAVAAGDGDARRSPRRTSASGNRCRAQCCRPLRRRASRRRRPCRRICRNATGAAFACSAIVTDGAGVTIVARGAVLPRHLDAAVRPPPNGARRGIARQS